MKKIFIIPLLALTGAALAGCGDDKVELPVDEFVTEYDNHEIQTITVGEYDFYDRQVYYSQGKGALWFYNKWEGNMDGEGKATEETVWSFIANKTAFKKGITKITFITTVDTGASKVLGSFGKSEFSDAQTSGKAVSVAANVEKEYTIKGDGESTYFALSTSGNVGAFIKNLMISSLTIWF